MFSRFLLLTLLLSSIYVSGCAEQNGQYIRDGKKYGNTSESFTESWWNYYERGRSFADGRFFQEAITDFHTAVKSRDMDMWQAQTDNMRFVDYFPHRELGVVFFLRREYDLAINELQYSIQSAPSAKAHYFLNKARAAKLYQQERDMSAPELHLEGSSTKETTNNFTHIIKGVAEDDTYVASIIVGDNRVPIELAKKKLVFTAEFPLNEGENVIQIIATDLVGKTTEHNLEILCDRSGPLVDILQVRDEGKEKVVQGVASDSGGLKSLEINGNPWKITGASPAYYFKFVLPEGRVTMVATDHAGNVTRATLSESEPEEDPLLDPPFADLEPSALFQQSSMMISDVHTPMSASVQEQAVDTDPPLINLKNLGRIQETYEDNVLLEGMVADFSPIHSISVNGVPISTKNGKKLYFTQLKKLAEGDNEFLIVAVDKHGNRSEKNIKIIRKVQYIHKIGSRMSVAVLPFDHQGEASPIRELIHDQMIDSFLEQKRFNIVEWKEIDTVVKEHRLRSPDLDDMAVDFGNIAAADAILAGTVIESPDSVEIIGRLIDTGTSTILASNDIFSEDKSSSSLNNILDTLALKFKRDFPIFEGMLIEARNDEVTVDIGLNKQIKPNLHLICYRNGLEIKHPVTGKLLGAEPEILGELTIKEVFEESSKAVFHKQKGKAKMYDRFISK